ncbi:MAG: hypothetical protein ACK4UT_05295, partial [Moraxellaceae bacterium]
IRTRKLDVMDPAAIKAFAAEAGAVDIGRLTRWPTTSPASAWPASRQFADHRPRAQIFQST